LTGTELHLGIKRRDKSGKSDPHLQDDSVSHPYFFISWFQLSASFKRLVAISTAIETKHSYRASQDFPYLSLSSGFTYISCFLRKSEKVCQMIFPDNLVPVCWSHMLSQFDTIDIHTYLIIINI
jgi:hypothetical protein